MIRETVNAFLACVVTFALCAVAYPAAVYGLGHTLFPAQAEGSLIERDGKVIGSSLIAQPFASERYFAPRPSAAGATGYAADAASGSNLGTTNPALHDRIALEAAKQILRKSGDADLKGKLERLDAVQADLKAKKDIKEPTPADTEAITKLEADAATAQADVLARSAELGKTDENLVPVDLVMTSGAGLDPEISPEAARYQAGRVATARKIPVDRVLKLIGAHINSSGALIGAPPRVNVLQINLDLDKESPSDEAPKPTSTTPEPPSPAADAAPAPSPEARPIAEAPRAVPALDPAPGMEAAKERAEAALREVKGLKAQVARLAEVETPNARKLEELGGRVGEFSRDIQAIRADLKAVRDGIRPEPASPEIEKQIRDLKAEVEALRESARKDATAAPAAKPDAAPPDLAPATALFRARKYAEAASAFRALAASHPDDARPWYLAAISNGLATSRWKGETEELLNKGMDRERAGTSPAADIDAATADLTKDTGREWLTYYRRRAAAR